MGEGGRGLGMVEEGWGGLARVEVVEAGLGASCPTSTVILPHPALPVWPCSHTVA